MKKIRKSIAFVLFMVMMLSVLCSAPFDVFAVETYNVHTDAELVSALYNISLQDSGSYTIALQEDINHNGGYSMNKNTINIVGNGHTINFTGSGQGFKVYSGAVLNLGLGNNDSLILNGDGETHNEKGDPAIPDNDNPGMIHINGADSVCNMNSGVVVQNHRGNNYLGGGVTVESGTFNMNGGTIDRCGIDGGSVCYGGGVAVYGKGKFVMNGGTISNCYALSDAEQIQSNSNYNDKYKTAMGGGVLVTGESTFIMNGGTITNNRATRRGGGVAIVASQYQSNYNKNKAVINGGTISNNTSKVGGGIFVSGYEMPYCAGITFSAVVADTITVENSTNVTGNSKSLNNKPEKALSGSDIIPDQGFNMYGGTISGNTADIAGGGLSLFSVAETSTIKNATINSNTVNYDSEITNDYNDYVDGYPHYDNNGKGGGILIAKYGSGAATIDSCTINENTTAKNGGGIAVINADKETHIKDTTINSNTSGDRGAGIYYSTGSNKSKVYLSGADTVQNNIYNNHLNNVNVLSVSKPINIEGSLEGSEIGLSDPRLWDDNMTDAEAPDDGSSTLLTKGYDIYNPNVRPDEYFTSDHETWIVDYSALTESTKTINRYKFENAQAYTSLYTSATANNGMLLGADSTYSIPLYLKAETFSKGCAQSVEQIYNEMLTRYENHYTIKSIGETTSVFTTDDRIEVTVEKQTGRVVVTSKSIDYPNRYTTLTAQLSYQSSCAADGEIYFDVSGSTITSNNVYYKSGTTPQTIPTFYTRSSAYRGSLLYDEIGRISAKLSASPTRTKDNSVQTSITGGDEVRLVRRTAPIKFHDNKDKVNEGEDKLFRVYNATDTSEPVANGYHELVNYKVPEFYNIPSFAEDDYVFAGWYTVPENDNNSSANAFEFDAEIPASVTDVYAHWIPVGEVEQQIKPDDPENKETNDFKELPEGMNGKYKGFELFGVQIRPEANFDHNQGDYTPGGLRFITSISEELLTKIDALSDKTTNGNKVEYGFVTAAESTVETVVNNTVFTVDKSTYKLQYRGANVNGVDTLLASATPDERKTPNNFRYITNVDCTSEVGGYGSNPRIQRDHKNFTNYRLATFVVTYDDDETGENKGKNIAARAYMRYYDGNGLLRTFYNDYAGTNFYGGCSTKYNDLEAAFEANRNTVS